MTDAEPPIIAPDWELFTPAHDALRMQVRDWVAGEIHPHVDRWEAVADFPRELFASAGAAGLFGHKVGPEFGGSGPDFLADAVVTEELALARSGGVAAALGAHKDLGPYYVWRFGTDEQRARWVAPALRGELVGALGVTEPEAGSDVASIRTRALRQPGGDWVLDGAKTFITNGSWADYVVVAAVTDPATGGHHGQSLFVVEATDPGFEARRIPTLGWRPSHTGELSFSGVRLPADRLVGGDDMRNQGFVCIMRNFQWERLVMALASVVASRAGLRAAVATLRDTPGAFTSPWRFRFAELATEIDGAGQLTYDALRRHLHGEDAITRVSMAKWYACELAARVADATLQAYGAAGTGAMPQAQRALRDARLGPIGGGTTEIMHEVIGRTLGL